MNQFKPGDKVRCIDASRNSNYHLQLEKNKVYTVRNTLDNYKGETEQVFLHELGGLNWTAKRFEKVEEDTKEYQCPACGPWGECDIHEDKQRKDVKPLIDRMREIVNVPHLKLEDKLLIIDANIGVLSDISELNPTAKRKLRKDVALLTQLKDELESHEKMNNIIESLKEILEYLEDEGETAVTDGFEAELNSILLKTVKVMYDFTDHIQTGFVNKVQIYTEKIMKLME